jgi:hypothetical protein
MYLTVGLVVLLYSVAIEGHNECTGTLLHWMCCFVVQCCQRGYLSQWMYRYIVTLNVLFCCTLLPTRVSVTMNVQVHCYTECVVLLNSVANEGICHNECTGTLLHWMCCFVVQFCQRGYLPQWMYRYIVTLDVLFCCTVLPGYLPQWMYRYIATLDVLFCCTVLPTRVSVTMNVQVHCYTGCVVLLYSVANEGIYHNECTGTLLHWMCCFVVQGICLNECTGTLLHWMSCFAKLPMWI